MSMHEAGCRLFIGGRSRFPQWDGMTARNDAESPVVVAGLDQNMRRK